MKKYMLLVTISLALIVTTVVAGLVFRPTSQLNTESQSPAPHIEDGARWFSTVSYRPDVPASLPSRVAINGPAVFLNFPDEVDTDMEFTLVSEFSRRDFIESHPDMCTELDTPDRGYSTLQEQANQSYWQQVKVWLIPAADQITLAQDDKPLDKFILVKGDVDQWQSNCPLLIDEDV